MKNIDSVPAALEQAAILALQFTAAPRDYLGPATSAMKEQAALGERLAAAIRALHVTAAPAAAPQVVADEREMFDRMYLSMHSFHTKEELDKEWHRTGAMFCAALAAAPVQPVVVPEGLAEPTYMTEEQGRDWAWKDVKKDVGTKGWTAGDNGNFFGFFVHGWNYRGQFEKQRFAAPAARGDAKELTDQQIKDIAFDVMATINVDKELIAFARAAIAAKAAS